MQSLPSRLYFIPPTYLYTHNDKVMEIFSIGGGSIEPTIAYIVVGGGIGGTYFEKVSLCRAQIPLTLVEVKAAASA